MVKTWPNQPRTSRGSEAGKLVGRAIENWDSDACVAIYGSGGMSHFVIDEALDKVVLDALANRDGEALTSIDESLYQSSVSELKIGLVRQEHCLILICKV